MAQVWTMGEILVEIMRAGVDEPLDRAGVFKGPYPSGAPAIFADTVARLGHGAGIIGGVGGDAFGRCVLGRLRADGVNTDYVAVDPDGSTACAFVTYFSDGSREFLFHLSRTPAVRARGLETPPDGENAFFHIMGCSLLSHPDFCDQIIKTARAFHASGASVSFDPNIRAELLRGGNLKDIVEPVMRMCKILLPGVEELLLLTGQDSLNLALAHVFSRYPVEVIALKRGGQGCEIVTRAQRFSLGVYPVDVVDTTGAGDCFDAAFLCGLLEKRPLNACAGMAAAAGALNSAAFGPMEGGISPRAIEELQRRYPQVNRDTQSL